MGVSIQSFWYCCLFWLCHLISRHVYFKLSKPRRLNCRVFFILLNALKFICASPTHSLTFILLVPQAFWSVFLTSAYSPFYQPRLYLFWAGHARKFSSGPWSAWRPTLRRQTLRRELRYASEWVGLRFLSHSWVGRRPESRVSERNFPYVPLTFQINVWDMMDLCVGGLCAATIRRKWALERFWLKCPNMLGTKISLNPILLLPKFVVIFCK